MYYAFYISSVNFLFIFFPTFCISCCFSLHIGNVNYLSILLVANTFLVLFFFLAFQCLLFTEIFTCLCAFIYQCFSCKVYSFLALRESFSIQRSGKYSLSIFFSVFPVFSFSLSLFSVFLSLFLNFL